jgi:hypothetical protein
MNKGCSVNMIHAGNHSRHLFAVFMEGDGIHKNSWCNVRILYGETEENSQRSARRAIDTASMNKGCAVNMIQPKRENNTKDQPFRFNILQN